MQDGWRLRDLGAFILLAVFFEGLMARFVFTFWPTASAMLIQGLVTFIPLFVLWIVVFRASPESLANLFHWSIPSYKKALKYIVAGYFALIGILAIMPDVGLQEPYTGYFGSDITAIIFLFISAGILAPIIEEVVFRSYVQRVLVGRVGKYFGILLTSILFALIHGQPQVFLSLFVVGFILGLVYEDSKSLPISIAIHALNNVVALIVTIFVLPSLV